MTAEKKRWLIIFSILTLAVLSSWQIYEFFAHEFSLENISYALPEEKEKAALVDELERRKLQGILEQTFTYIDQGTQTYVFVSQDQKYVLKFFKFRHLKPSVASQWFSWMPLVSTYQEEQIASKHRKLARLFFGYQVAYERDKENNALIFLHLNPTRYLKQQIHLIDRYGFTHQVNLDDVVFVIQEKGESTKNVISRLLEQGDVHAAKLRFRQILDLYVSEYEKGLWDRDHNVMHNTGFVGEKPIRLDVGRLRADDRFREPSYFKSDLEKVGLKRIDRWLNTHYPQYRKEIDEDIKLKLNEIFAKRPHFPGPPLINSPSQ